MKRALLAAVALFGALTPSGADEWPMFGGRADRNMVSSEKNLPLTWSFEQKKNVKWAADLGTQVWGTPVVSGGRVYIGTNNEKPRNPAVKGDRGVLMCLSAADGRFLWQALHEKLYPNDAEKAEAEDWPKTGICSTPAVAGDRVYYVNNRAELVCADALGFSDDENDGPFLGEKLRGKEDADLVWLLDMRKELGVKPHMASASSPLVVGDLVFVVTGNGAHGGKVENPQAPSFIAVKAATGEVAWQNGLPGDRILGGQWGSPSYGAPGGRPQVAFPGGDGWLYAFEPGTGKLLWKFNCKAHEKVDSEGKPETHNHLLATPVYAGDLVLVAVGEDTETPGPPGCLRAIDARKRGDITKDGEVWKIAGNDFGRSMATVAVQDGLVFAIEQDGFMSCVELAGGKRLWRHDFLSSMWWGPLVADGKVYARTADGDVVILAAAREKKILAKNSLPNLSHGLVVASGGVLFIAGDNRLYAVGP